MKFLSEDNGNARVYYGDGRLVYCWQDDGSWGRHDFHFYRCSKDGEPSHEVRPLSVTPLTPGDTAVGRDLNDFLNGIEKAARDAYLAEENKKPA